MIALDENWSASSVWTSEDAGLPLHAIVTAGLGF